MRLFARHALFIRKIISFSLGVLLLFSPSTFVYAQEPATPSGILSEASKSADVPFEATPSSDADTTEASKSAGTNFSDDPISTLSGTGTTPTPTPEIILGPSGVLSQSASMKQPFSVRNLAKRSFRADEHITVVVDNAWVQDVHVSLFDVDGLKQNVEMKTVSDGDPLVLELIPNQQFRSGRYRLAVTDTEGKTATQDFTWGVLAINTNKSMYGPGETAKLAFAVLDETGMMECHANVRLSITHEGTTDTLTTADGSIRTNAVCEEKIFTLTPDYEAAYATAGSGTYDMKLSAETENGTYTITDAFEVRDTIPFAVERVTATRIFPPATYPVTFAITFNENFSGDIEEVVPGNFAVSPQSGVPAYTETRKTVAPSERDTSGVGVLSITKPFDHDHPVSLGFGKQLRDPGLKMKYSDYGLLGHDGVDFDMAVGTAVLAVDDGVVVKADANGDYGTTLVISHTWGKSYYGHLSMITKHVGDTVAKGHPVAISGNTGLTTGPHLHFGIKLNINDIDNGYYGKVNPWPALARAEEATAVLVAENQASVQQATDSASVATESGSVAGDATTAVSTGPEETVQVLRWHVTAKKGDVVNLGYQFQVPNISPQFYHLGPLTFTSNNETVFSESRQWQLAIDASGSGANGVDPSTGTTSATGQTYTFTFDPSEAMDSGGMTITVPSSGSPDWSAPQGTGGTAGYTTAVGTGNATVGNVLNNADEEDPTSPAGIWKEIDMDMCGTYNSLNAAGDILVDASVKQEGAGSIVCKTTTGVAAAADNNDSWGFVYDADQNWDTFCNGAKCGQIGYWIRAASNLEAFEFDVSATAALPTTLVACAGSITTANQWEYKTCDISAATLTTVRAFGFSCTNNTCNPFDAGDVWVDEFLIGPGVPTFAGRVAVVRFVDLAAADTITVKYGDTAGGAGSTVTNSATAGVHTFTTVSMLAAGGSYVNLAGGSPTITLSSTGPTMDQLLRHGAWFSVGVEQPFTF